MTSQALLKIALLQIDACGADQDANLRKGIEFCRNAKELGADIALFPEMWNIGYTPFDPVVWEHGFDPTAPEHQAAARAWQAQAIPRDSDFIQAFQSLAIDLDMAIVATYLEEWPNAPRNTATVIDRHGKTVLTYAKVHTCGFSLESYVTPGETFPVSRLDTSAGPVDIGVMICFDREFPETARILMLNGAEIILIPNACELEQNRLAQCRTRAFENMVGLAVANYPASGGNSAAFSPIAFDPSEQSQELCLVQADLSEGIRLAEFDMNAIRDYRLREVWGDAYRRPETYGRITNG